MQGMQLTSDFRLVANVERLAGSHCHEAANLLHCYSLAAKLCERLREEEGADDEMQTARELFERSEVELRRFLSQRRSLSSSPLHTRHRHQDRDEIASPIRN